VLVVQHHVDRPVLLQGLADHQVGRLVTGRGAVQHAQPDGDQEENRPHGEQDAQ
jgi:hypothetical protein